MSLDHVNILFQLLVFLFAISVHESAHAWTAWRLGDPTAQMLGRITLNPIRHIDPVGTIVLPAILMMTGMPVFGWAKPVPVDPRNFKHEVRDDILTSVAGPLSNFTVVLGALVFMGAIAFMPEGRAAIGNATYYFWRRDLPIATDSILVPFSLLLYNLIVINVVLGIFNLIPLPPLDGSHVLRHLLPPDTRRVYDMVGMMGLLLLFLFGGPVIWRLIAPVLQVINSVLARL